MRKRYETDEDLRNEREVAAVIERHYRLTAIKLPDHSRADFLMHRDGVAKSVIEIKCRNVSSAKYETLLLSKGKYCALLDWTNRGFKAAIVVRWTDVIGVCPIPVKHSLGTGGRTDRGDALDIESVVHIPIDCFALIPR
ncbi:MAG: hypothetical protein PWP11_3276 [Thauera sp.]|nr:hypothetical protein [Thauera sp.]MDI3491999.1 hypothetical protein [Thauera sp.]